ncbi:hypothetical protein F511_42820 [Dorcoceras hygrometricum]|uniref:Uncharacterized protein n=1 Tax=Dorcoceras hygrometricum TaxID=472368 RepID=A0A2Z7B026_9LAMI|nr:hypothetical protein F511_42820 [Dorcoceras hygrometricum]
MGGGTPPDAMAACARATSRIARDILACWSSDGRLLDMHWLHDCGTLAGRWSSANCASVGRRRARCWPHRRCALVAREATPGRTLAVWFLHAGRTLDAAGRARRLAAGRYVRRAWRDTARPCAVRNMVATAVRRSSGDVVTDEFF